MYAARSVLRCFVSSVATAASCHLSGWQSCRRSRSCRAISRLGTVARRVVRAVLSQAALEFKGQYLQPRHAEFTFAGLELPAQRDGGGLLCGFTLPQGSLTTAQVCLALTVVLTLPEGDIFLEQAVTFARHGGVVMAQACALQAEPLHLQGQAGCSLGLVSGGALSFGL